MNTLVISDIHLASEVCKGKTLLKFLKENGKRFDRIIILGDLFDHANFNRLKAKHWGILDQLRHLSKHKEIVWIEGNHDEHIFTEVISNMIGAKIVCQKDHYEIVAGEKKIVLVHGHQFDTFITDMRWKILSEIATSIYSWVQYFDTNDYFFSRYIKKRSKTLLKISKSNRDRAWDFARKHNAQIVICGHTHHAASETSSDGILYLNTGSWVDTPCSYVTISSDGLYELCDFKLSKDSEKSPNDFTPI